MTFEKWCSVASKQLRDELYMSFINRGTGCLMSEYYYKKSEYWIYRLNEEQLFVDAPESVVYKLSSEPYTMLEFNVIQKNDTKKLLMPVDGAWQEIPNNILTKRDCIPFYQNADWVCYHVYVGYTIGQLEITEKHIDHFWKWYDRVTE